MRILSDQLVRELIDLEEVVKAVEHSFQLEASSEVKVPVRKTIDYSRGWLRLMPAIIVGKDFTIMGAKIMNLVGQGNNDKVQYLILLYDAVSGELLSVMDGAIITQMRTGAVTAAVARRIIGEDVVQRGIVGSGFVAEGQLRALVTRISCGQILVYSPNAENRERFADSMGGELGVEIKPCESPVPVFAESRVVLLATRSKEPVLQGASLRRDALLLSTGSTRHDLREMDLRTMDRARCVFVDHVDQAIEESGDIQVGLEAGAIQKHHLMSASKLWADFLIPSATNRDLIVFKSSGTAVQDLVVAAGIYHKALEGGIGPVVQDVPNFRKLR
jgi:ornithine cyclodeaminase/alanine dehydrogenase